jgi:hypothetical protein
MKRKGFWIATGLLVVPVVIFYMLNAGTMNFKSLPIYGERISPDGVNQKDTIYYHIPDFKGLDQNGKEFSFKNLDDNIFITNFFFASRKLVDLGLARISGKISLETHVLVPRYSFPKTLGNSFRSSASLNASLTKLSFSNSALLEFRPK